MKLKVTIEYDGRAFSGWQIQPDTRTVQGELKEAFSVLANAAAKSSGGSVDDEFNVTGSGRTDAGVHALGQVASVKWPEDLPLDLEKLPASLNGITSPEIVIKSVEQVDDAFDARRSEHTKTYSYNLLLRSSRAGYYDGRAWCVSPRNLDLQAMIEVSKLFFGTHDFHNFRASDCCADTTVRTLSVSQLSRADADLLVYTACGTGFLKQMIRMIVGAVVAVGQGRLSEGDIEKLLSAEPRNCSWTTAPAEGLMLERVRY